MKRQSARLDWDSIREIYLPFCTAKAIEQRYYAYVRDASDNSDDDNADADLAEHQYLHPFREWVQAPLSVDVRSAAAMLRRAESLQVRI